MMSSKKMIATSSSRSVLKLLSRSTRSPSGARFLTSNNNRADDEDSVRLLAVRPPSFRGWAPQQTRCPHLAGLSSSSLNSIDRRWFSSSSGAAFAAPLEEVEDYVDSNSDEDEAKLTEGKPLFADLQPPLNPKTLQALTKLGITTMTDIQAQTYEAASQGNDVLGRSRTGSGKTLAFLLPVVERVLQDPSSDDRIPILVISPTRELAHQIHTTAERLLAGHQQGGQQQQHRGGRNHRHHGDRRSSSSGPVCQVMYGGTSKGLDLKQLDEPRWNPFPTVLTSTPGRLLDHLENSFLNKRNCSVKDLVANTEVLILDEFDRLLEMGFREDIRRILGYLPHKKNRQTLLFSATLPPNVQKEIDNCIQSDHVHVDCIQDSDLSETVTTVQQSYVVLPPDQIIVGVVQALRYFKETSQTDPKMMVFFNTTAQVQYFAELLRQVMPDTPIYELHSRKNQSSRTNTSDKFRRSKRGILCTSDVSARGVDYPKVTHVVQVGAASDRETYIHRLGRTARAGTTGQGVMLLLPHEQQAGLLRKDYKGIDIPVHEELRDVLNDEDNVAQTSFAMEEAMHTLHHKACDCYRSLLGFYTQHFKKMGVRRSTEEVVHMINDFADQAKLQERPGIPSKVAQMYGLMHHPDINVSSNRGGHRDGGRGGGFDGGRGGSFGGGRAGGGFDGGRRSSFGGDRERSFEGRYDSGRLDANRGRRNGRGGGENRRRHSSSW